MHIMISDHKKIRSLPSLPSSLTQLSISKKKIGRESLTTLLPLVAIDLELQNRRGRRADERLENVVRGLKNEENGANGRYMKAARL
jgi:hypothetical protein